MNARYLCQWNTEEVESAENAWEEKTKEACDGNELRF